MSPVRAPVLQLSLDLQLRTLQLSRYARSKRKRIILLTPLDRRVPCQSSQNDQNDQFPRCVQYTSPKGCAPAAATGAASAASAVVCAAVRRTAGVSPRGTSWVQATGRLFFFPDGFVALNRPSFEVFVVLEKTGR